MFPQRTLRVSRTLTHNLSAVRAPVRCTGRRFASHGSADTGLTGTADNAFNRERLAVKKHASETSDFWRKLSIYVVIPSLALASANAYVLWNEHWEHWEHSPPPAERPQYSYMNIRSKAYPWGDGDKTLFWNDKTNYHKKGD